jgi:hypothetical protein
MWFILVALTLHPVLELCGLGNHWSSGPLWRGAAVAVVVVLLRQDAERMRQDREDWPQRDYEQLSRFFKLQGEHAFVCSWYSLYVANVVRGLVDVGIAPGRLEHRG